MTQEPAATPETEAPKRARRQISRRSEVELTLLQQIEQLHEQTTAVLEGITPDNRLTTSRALQLALNNLGQAIEFEREPVVHVVHANLDQEEFSALCKKLTPSEKYLISNHLAQNSSGVAVSSLGSSLKNLESYGLITVNKDSAALTTKGVDLNARWTAR